MQLTVYLCILAHLIVSVFAYSIPVPKVEIIKPKGVRISIPHEDGIKLVAFHENIDQPITLYQPGEYSVELTEPINGRWVFDNLQSVVDANTKVNYWIYVQHGTDVYRKLGGSRLSEEGAVDLTANAISSGVGSITSAFDCELSKTTVDRKPVCKGQLIFEDNFDNLNLTKWQREIRLSSDVDDAEFVSFQAREENSYTADGQLHIVPSLLNQVPGFNSSLRTGTLDLGSQCTGINDRLKECRRTAQRSQILPPVVSARIRTKYFFSFRYGKVQVRAKLPKGDWLFPLILLEPVENYYGFTGYASGQIRVAFIRGNEVLEDRDGEDISGKRLYGAVVLSSGEALRGVFLQSGLRKSHLGDDFHTYTITWREDVITFEIDNDFYGNYIASLSKIFSSRNLPYASTWELGTDMAPFDREFFLTLGVSVGGHSDFPNGILNSADRKTKPWANTDPKAESHFWNNREDWLKTWIGPNVGLHVDYVRVYAL